jgi:hypothetical protein
MFPWFRIYSAPVKITGRPGKSLQKMKFWTQASLLGLALANPLNFFFKSQFNKFEDAAVDFKSTDFVQESALTSSSFVKLGVTGKKNHYQVYRHQRFPRYSLRVKTDSTLCDPGVKQV